MTIEEAMQYSIAKATEAENDALYYGSVIQSEAYQTDAVFQRTIDASISIAQQAASYHQEIKAALATLL